MGNNSGTYMSHDDFRHCVIMIESKRYPGWYVVCPDPPSNDAHVKQGQLYGGPAILNLKAVWTPVPTKSSEFFLQSFLHPKYCLQAGEPAISYCTRHVRINRNRAGWETWAIDDVPQHSMRRVYNQARGTWLDAHDSGDMMHTTPGASNPWDQYTIHKYVAKSFDETIQEAENRTGNVITGTYRVTTGIKRTDSESTSMENSVSVKMEAAYGAFSAGMSASTSTTTTRSSEFEWSVAVTKEQSYTIRPGHRLKITQKCFMFGEYVAKGKLVYKETKL